jgi:hypothetical protein
MRSADANCELMRLATTAEELSGKCLILQLQEVTRLLQFRLKVTVGRTVTTVDYGAVLPVPA